MCVFVFTSRPLLVLYFVRGLCFWCSHDHIQLASLAGIGRISTQPMITNSGRRVSRLRRTRVCRPSTGSSCTEQAHATPEVSTTVVIQEGRGSGVNRTLFYSKADFVLFQSGLCFISKPFALQHVCRFQPYFLQISYSLLFFSPLGRSLCHSQGAGTSWVHCGNHERGIKVR